MRPVVPRLQRLTQLQFTAPESLSYRTKALNLPTSSAIAKAIATSRLIPYRRQISMAWLSGGKSNSELINNLYKNGLISSARVKDAMLGVCCVMIYPVLCSTSWSPILICIFPSHPIYNVRLLYICVFPSPFQSCKMDTSWSLHLLSNRWIEATIRLQPHTPIPLNQSATVPRSQPRTCTLRPLNLYSNTCIPKHGCSISDPGPDTWHMC